MDRWIDGSFSAQRTYTIATAYRFDIWVSSSLDHALVDAHAGASASGPEKERRRRGGSRSAMTAAEQQPRSVRRPHRIPRTP